MSKRFAHPLKAATAVVFSLVIACFTLTPASAATGTTGIVRSLWADRPPVRALVLTAQTWPAFPRAYVVRPGDTLTSIAARQYGHANRWPALWWANRNTISNPAAITVGEHLRLSGWHPLRAWLRRDAQNAIPVPRPAPAAPPQSTPVTVTTSSAQISTAGMAGFEACVISRESGGNPQVMNSTGHYGLYQFSYQTWVAYGGNGADFGHASVAEQRQVFLNAMATPGGASNWSPYDGC